MCISNISKTLEKFCKPKRNYKPLIDNQILAYRTPLSEKTLQLIAMKKAAHKNYHKFPSVENKMLRNFARNQANRAVKKDQNDLISKHIDFSADKQQIWKNIHKITGCEKFTVPPPELLFDNKILKGKAEILEVLAPSFKKKAERLVAQAIVDREVENLDTVDIFTVKMGGPTFYTANMPHIS